MRHYDEHPIDQGLNYFSGTADLVNGLKLGKFSSFGAAWFWIILQESANDCQIDLYVHVKETFHFDNWQFPEILPSRNLLVALEPIDRSKFC